MCSNAGAEKGDLGLVPASATAATAAWLMTQERCGGSSARPLPRLKSGDRFLPPISVLA